MHELSVTQGIVKICLEEARKHQLMKVEEIRLKVGELSGIIPDCIQYYFNIISKDTLLKGAVILIDKVAIEIKCNGCNTEFVLDKIDFCCPKCGSFNIKIIKGNEFYIDSIKGE